MLKTDEYSHRKLLLILDLNNFLIYEESRGNFFFPYDDFLLS